MRKVSPVREAKPKPVARVAVIEEPPPAQPHYVRWRAGRPSVEAGNMIELVVGAGILLVGIVSRGLLLARYEDGELYVQPGDRLGSTGQAERIRQE